MAPEGFLQPAPVLKSVLGSASASRPWTTSRTTSVEDPKQGSRSRLPSTISPFWCPPAIAVSAPSPRRTTTAPWVSNTGGLTRVLRGLAFPSSHGAGFFMPRWSIRGLVSTRRARQSNAFQDTHDMRPGVTCGWTSLRAGHTQETPSGRVHPPRLMCPEESPDDSPAATRQGVQLDDGVPARR